MNIEGQRGWIIDNGGAPVFQTLRTTRAECIIQYRMRNLMSKDDWNKAVRNVPDTRESLHH